MATRGGDRRFVYLRFHGQTRLYGSRHDDALRASAERIRAWRDASLELVG
jgi:uncharacterized protein YecE (DUF72 family)